MPRPRFDAYVLHNSDDRDVFYTLATALERAWQFQAAEIPAERHDIHLRADVHRSHGHRHGLLVVDEVNGVDQGCRLAAVHARREGVDGFGLLILEAGAAGGGRADAVELRARALLTALGVEGDAAPVVRAPPTRGAGRTAPTQAAMRELLALLDDLPALPLAPPLVTMPAEFAIEVELLDLVCPLLLPARQIRETRATAADTAALEGGAGGSFEGGAPYLEVGEAWPTCPGCGRAMAGLLQIDTRDVGWPTPHGLYTLFSCSEFRCGREVLRYHASPSPSRRRPGPPGALRYDQDVASILRPGEPCWLLPDAEVFAHAHPELAARLCEVGYDDDPLAVFDLVADAIGVSALLATSHFGGHHLTTVSAPTPRCGECHEPCALLVQVDAGDDQRCLWACPRHRTQVFHRVVP